VISSKHARIPCRGRGKKEKKKKKVAYHFPNKHTGGERGGVAKPRRRLTSDGRDLRPVSEQVRGKKRKKKKLIPPNLLASYAWEVEVKIFTRTGGKGKKKDHTVSRAPKEKRKKNNTTLVSADREEGGEGR